MKLAFALQKYTTHSFKGKTRDMSHGNVKTHVCDLYNICTLCGMMYVIYFLFCSMSLKVPAIVEEVEKALSHNMCVVIGLQTTGEVMLCTCIRPHPV